MNDGVATKTLILLAPYPDPVGKHEPACLASTLFQKPLPPAGFCGGGLA